MRWRCKVYIKAWIDAVTEVTDVFLPWAWLARSLSLSLLIVCAEVMSEDDVNGGWAGAAQTRDLVSKYTKS